MKKFFIISIFLILGVYTYAQMSLYGEVKNRYTQNPLSGAIVSIPSIGIDCKSDDNGHFHFYNIMDTEVDIKVSYAGYEDYKGSVKMSHNKHIVIYLDLKIIELDEVTVNSVQNKKSTLNTNSIGRNYIIENNSTSLAKTLANIPGISSMDIGSGFSKPVIRGLGFNRIAVVDKGVTQQDQQWGADHGLSIDQYDVNDIVVYKGPASLQYGSDAIGGTIEMLPVKVPAENVYFGEALFIGKSNNDLAGISVMNAIKRGKWYGRFRYTCQRYGDYRIPTDSITYLRTNLPIYNQRMKNTAGVEQNFSGAINYSNNRNLATTLNISNTYQKNGFFPGAHGVPSIDRLEHDGSYRNIELPYNRVNHFKIINNTTLKLNQSLSWIIDLGYQNNNRQERASFHTHYDNQSVPLDDPDLELEFKLQTYTLNSKILINENEKFNHSIGIQGSAQQNRIGGYGYLMPRYNQNAIGTYFLSNYELNSNWSFSGGARYDYGKIDIIGFYDDILAGYLKQQGYSNDDIATYAQRAYDATPHFTNFSASLGSIFKPNSSMEWKANIGKSFRFPTANELAANGVHHGAFRHEQGDPSLKQEEGYQLDLGYIYYHKRFTVNVSPYLTYFSNYIFLEPQGEWSVLPHAGQIYKYRGAEAMFAGGEIDIRIALHHHFDLSIGGQYVYNYNMTDKYPLPFTPPLSIRNELTYSNKYNSIQSYKISLQHQYYASQNRISRNEEKTPGANIFNIMASTDIKVDQFRFSLALQVQNIFNKKYYNHLSFYRKLNIPEPGRNFQLLLRIPFST